MVALSAPAGRAQAASTTVGHRDRDRDRDGHRDPGCDSHRDRHGASDRRSPSSRPGAAAATGSKARQPRRVTVTVTGGGPTVTRAVPVGRHG